ncbi:hypothetical protein QAD02_002641 [Eretmocerus hayati]|uniref:Uncharacterized protein n=1 Tax=Eretmocerus hayati TaxID=131215 RepID=A0ACC2NMC5_9HYME|nr:hypothetical protein QAD02_002641 [Eretmocerus hayati]
MPGYQVVRNLVAVAVVAGALVGGTEQIDLVVQLDLVGIFVDPELDQGALHVLCPYLVLCQHSATLEEDLPRQVSVVGNQLEVLWECKRFYQRYMSDGKTSTRIYTTILASSST